MCECLRGRNRDFTQNGRDHLGFAAAYASHERINLSPAELQTDITYAEAPLAW